MNALLNGLKAALLGTWLVISMGFGWWLWHIKTTVETTMRDTHTTVLEIGLTAKNLKEASGIWEKASQEQSKQTTAAMRSVAASAAQLTAFVSRTDDSLNSTLLPTLSNAIMEQNASLLNSEKQLQRNLQEMSQATQQAQKVLADADAQINSPDIKIAMDNFATSSANLATATHEGAASMTDIHAALDYEIKQLEAPVTKLKTAGLIALTVIRKLYF